MGKYARGRNAVAECQRSGQKMPYRDLVEDGHIPGLLVHPDWWEPKHPQEFPVTPTDDQALHRPSPEASKPTGEGDPLAGSTCPAQPDTLYNPSSHLTVALSGGETFVAVEDPLTFDIGTCVYIFLANASWFVTKTVVGADYPTYTVPLLTGVSGPALAGANVYVGVTGSGVLGT